jgi:hypothetical protein
VDKIMLPLAGFCQGPDATIGATRTEDGRQEEVPAAMTTERHGAKAGDPQEVLRRLRGQATCSVADASIVLGIGRSTAYAAARDGSLPTLTISHRRLVSTAKLRSMLGLEDEE